MPASGRLCGLAGPVFDGAVGFNAFKSSARCWIVSALPVFDGLVAFATCLVAFATLDSNIAAGKSFQNLETLERHRKGRTERESSAICGTLPPSESVQQLDTLPRSVGRRKCKPVRHFAGPGGAEIKCSGRPPRLWIGKTGVSSREREDRGAAALVTA